jgi:hypothetical protein
MKKLGMFIFLLLLTSYSMAQFDGEVIETIVVGGVAEVYFTHQEPEKIRKEISGKQIPEVIVSFKDGILEVNTKGEAHDEVVRIYVSGLDLKSVVVKDAAQFHGINSINSKTLAIKVEDHGSADMAVNVDNLKIIMSGGDLTISGKTNNCVIRKLNDHERGTLDTRNLIIMNQKLR